MTPKRPSDEKPEQPPTFDEAAERELDRAAEITLDDIGDAIRAWRTDASPPFRELLDAEPTE